MHRDPSGLLQILFECGATRQSLANILQMQQQTRTIEALANFAKTGKVLPEIDAQQLEKAIVEGDNARRDSDRVKFARLAYNYVADAVIDLYHGDRMQHLGLSYDPDDIDITDFDDSNNE